MTAHILALLITFLPGIASLTPKAPTDAEIVAEAQRRADEFCTPDYIYEDKEVPYVVQCAEPVPDCDDTVLPEHPYAARCKGHI